jgi:hypothetical protein
MKMSVNYGCTFKIGNEIFESRAVHNARVLAFGIIHKAERTSKISFPIAKLKITL